MDAPLRQAAQLAAAVWLVYVVTAGGTLATGDAVAMYEQAKSLVDRGALDVPADQSTEVWRGRDGLYYTPFGLGQPLYDIPFLLLGRVAADLTGFDLGDPDAMPKAAVAMGSTVTAAGTVGFAFLLAWRLSASQVASMMSALVLAFGTLLWPYSKFGFNATLTACVLTAGVYGIATAGTRRRWRSAALGGCGLGAAVLTRHEMLIAAVVCLIWLGWHVRRDPERIPLMVAASAGIAAALAVSAGFNWTRFGNPFWTGHRPALSWTGVPGLTVSPSGGLLLYSPAVIAVVALLSKTRLRAPVTVLILGVAVALGAFYASLDDWLGTRSYGPRYLVPLLPLLTAPLSLWAWPISRARRLLIVGYFFISVAVQLPGVLVDFSRAGIASGIPPQSVRRFDWQWAPIRLNIRQSLEAVPANARSFFGGSRPLGPPETTSLSARLAHSLDFWWMYLYHLGVWPRWTAALAATVPLALAATLLARLYRRSRGRCNTSVYPNRTHPP